jgi:hypothetical protein
MSLSPSTETSDLQKMEFSTSDHYDDDLDDSVLITPFVVSTGTLGLLSGGGDEDESIDPNTTCVEQGETYASMISHARVRAALKRPIQLCKFYNAPICLMVLEIELSDSKHTLARQMPSLMRFKAVDVTVEFKATAGASTLGPEIVMFCPEKYTGEPTPVEHSRSTTVGANIDTSNAIPVGLGAGLSRTYASHFVRTCKSSVTGRTVLYGSSPSIVKWNIKEDEALRQGVPGQLRFVMAVKNPGERAFNMKLNFSAYLGFNNYEFRVKKKQSVLSTVVNPTALRERALEDENGPEFGRIWQCSVIDSDLSSINLEDLTNLKGSTVGKTSIIG